MMVHTVHVVPDGLHHFRAECLTLDCKAGARGGRWRSPRAYLWPTDAVLEASIHEWSEIAVKADEIIEMRRAMERERCNQ